MRLETWHGDFLGQLNTIQRQRDKDFGEAGGSAPVSRAPQELFNKLLMVLTISSFSEGSLSASRVL
jgi:hypothetical protein